MKYKLMKLINNTKNLWINIKNLIKKFVKENKKLDIISIVALIVIIACAIIISNKTELGNTSGNLNNSGFSIEKGGWVYYLGLKDSNTDGIYRIKSNSDKKEKVSSDYGLYLNEADNFIYYLERNSGNYNIVKMKTNGEYKETVIKDVDTAKVTVAKNWIYYFKDSNFYRAKTNGEEKQILSKKSIENYEVVKNWIYYSYINDGKYVIAKMKTDGDNVTKIDIDSSNVFFLENNNIYYIYESYSENNQQYNYELYKVKTNGKNKEKIADIGTNVQLESINFDGNKIYYTKTDDNGKLAIYTIKLNGKDEKKIVEIKGFSTLLNIHDEWIYYTDLNENSDSEMFRIKTNGKNKQSL